MADALRVSPSVTKILVGGNKLGDEGTIILCDALRVSTVSKVQELGLSRNDIGPDGAKAVAALCAAMASLTSLDLSQNRLCGVATTIFGQRGTYTAEGITALADALRVSASMTRLNVTWNSLGEEGEAALLRKAIEGRSGFVFGATLSFKQQPLSDNSHSRYSHVSPH